MAPGIVADVLRLVDAEDQVREVDLDVEREVDAEVVAADGVSPKAQ